MDEPLFRWRAAFETRMDSAHDATVSEFRRQDWILEDDARAHVAWSERNERRPLTEAAQLDVRGMPAARGVLQAPEYDDEPTRGPAAGLRGGGGRRRGAGMQPPVESKRRRVSLATPSDDQHAEPQLMKWPEARCPSLRQMWFGR